MVNVQTQAENSSTTSTIEANNVETRTYYEDETCIIPFNKVIGIKKRSVIDHEVIVYSGHEHFLLCSKNKIDRFFKEYLTWLNDIHFQSRTRGNYDN